MPFKHKVEFAAHLFKQNCQMVFLNVKISVSLHFCGL
jgi:hypothetical protein